MCQDEYYQYFVEGGRRRETSKSAKDGYAVDCSGESFMFQCCRKEIKRDLLRESSLAQKLENKGFHFERFWSRNPCIGYEGIQNEAYKIR